MDLPGQVGWVGSAPGGSLTKTEAKYSEKDQQFQYHFLVFSLVFNGIYSAASLKCPVYVCPKTLLIFRNFEPKGGLRVSTLLENYFRTVSTG